MTTRWLALGLVIAGCVVGDGATGDDYWSDTTDDAGASADLRAKTDARVAVVAGKTDTAELVEEVPVGRSESSAERRVVLALGAGALPSLAKGDRLMIPAEVQATARCDVGQTGPGCDYNPTIRVQVELAGQALATQTQTCTHADHHCMFVFTPSDTATTLARACSGCEAHVVMWAWDGHARAGGADKVLVGGNDGDYLANGKVEQDVARIMAVREHAVTASDRAKRETHASGDVDVNTNANPVVVYAHALTGGGDLEPGEQYVVEAKVAVATSDRARVSAQLVVSHDPHDGDGGGVDKITPGQISEQNGINCTSGTSPCTLTKVAVFSVDARVSGPVYVNVVVKSAVPGGGSVRVTARRGDGFVRSVRYAASLR